MKALKNLLLKISIKLYLCFKSTPLKLEESHNLDFSKKTFLIFSNTALGDTLLSTPAIYSLKSSFPECKIYLFVHKNYLSLFEELNFIDGYIPYYGGYKNFLSTLKKIKKLRVDVALLLHSNGPQDIPTALLSGAKYILKTPNKSQYSYLLSHLFKEKGEHTIKNRLNLVEFLGAKNIQKNMQLPKRYYEPISKVDDKIKIGFQIGAANIYKMWQIERFGELADRLISEFENIEILITGSAKESELAQKIADNKKIINLCGQYDIKSLPYLIKSFDLLITNDTGTMHLAIALHVKTLSLFSPTDSKTIGPYQNLELHKAIQKDGSFIQNVPKSRRDDSAMGLILVDEVFKEAKNIIDKAKSENSDI